MEVWLYINIASIVLGIKYIRGEIRCYCNDASCISKGYMCKSLVDRCFSLHSPDGASAIRSVHGCAELLSGRLSTVCSQPEGDYVEYDTTGSDVLDRFRSRVVCCADDMCNYNAEGAQGPPAALPLPPAPPLEAKSNGRIGAMQAHKTPDQKLIGGSSERRSERGHQTSHEDTLRRDIWFRAAVIAVPISGLVILVLLVLLAVRMLRGDYVIKTSSTNRNATRDSVALADECGVVRTILAPPGELERSSELRVSENEHSKCWRSKELVFKVDSANRLRYEKLRPSSNCCESDLCDFCQCKVKCVAVTKNSNDLPV